MWQISLGIFIWRALKSLFSEKKTLLTGPPSSGKTTFLRHISKEEIPNGPSGVPTTYRIGNGDWNKITDLSGAEVWLKNKFDEYIKSHDYILFFFDISEYILNEEYRNNANARVDMINKNIKSSQIVLLIGTHNDCAVNNYKSKVECSFAGKPYQSLLRRIVYIDTRKKECVKTILFELKR